jgi:ubiquinone/menaquinone biosynthesis C-methylase UbiE
MVDFDKKARTWDDPEKINRAKKVAEKLRKRIPLKKTMSALEFGCGTGLLSFELQNDLGKITLADNSEEMLKAVREKILVSRVENMYPMRINLMENVSFNNQFDLIYSLMALHHVNNIERVISRFSNMIHTGGYLGIADLDKEDGSFHEEDFDGYFGFDRKNLSDILFHSGFRNIKFDNCCKLHRLRDNIKRDYTIFLLTCRKEK